LGSTDSPTSSAKAHDWRPDARVRITPDTDSAPPIKGSAAALRSLQLQRVTTAADSRRWNEYIERYHSLGHKPLPGAQLRYFVHAQGQLLALLGFGAAAWQTYGSTPWIDAFAISLPVDFWEDGEAEYLQSKSRNTLWHLK
jgi:hypothetical protein